MSKQHQPAIAANRFGLGARPGDLAQIASDPKSWLLAQVDDPAAYRLDSPDLLSSKQGAERFFAYNQARNASQNQQMSPEASQADAEQAFRKSIRSIGEIALQETGARTQHALATQAPFAERLVLFWSNHFTVSATKVQTLSLAGAFEREVIRANMTGSFEDMLAASTRHPGMLLYLDQAQSAGPNSRAGRRRDAGLNENLAREILELHSLGAQGGYTQADVTEFAKALTGWTVNTPRFQRFTPGEPGEFTFAALLHEPGARTILGKSYPEGGEEQAAAVLKDIARHPATARRVATKLARHFIADEPPASAVAALEQTFRATNGDLPALHRKLVDLNEAWSPELRKFKSPNEFIVSALRFVGAPRVEPTAMATAYALLGQGPFRAPSPEGWPDDAESWAGPDAVMKRLEWTQGFAARIGDRGRPEAAAEAALGAFLSAGTRQAIRRAESGTQALTLALMSPEFQRR